MTQTNTYQALCDSVGAYEMTCGLFAIPHKHCQYMIQCSECNANKFKKNYPPAIAEQRERLEELILDKFRACSLIYVKTAVSAEYLVYLKDNCFQERYFFMAKTKSDALYALTHKLYKNGVLSKEEVAKALKGGE